MPRKSPSVPTINPIDALSQKIAAAANGKCGINVSSELSEAVRSYLKTQRSSSAVVLTESVDAIVSALDKDDGICSRLESLTFATVFLTLLHAEYSHQKERGIIILAASLHYDTHKPRKLRTIVKRKEIIGEDCVRALLPCFTNTRENARIRRWAGVMLLQLLDGTDKNIIRIESCPESSRRALGSMLLEEPDELLKITCGELLRALINWEIKPEYLWPIGTDPAHYESFPTSSLSEKRWNVAFQTYIDEITEESSISQGSGRVYFAQALVLTPMGYKISGDIVNILLDNDISMCTQTSGKTFSESLEIPFELILDANIEKIVWEGVVASVASAVDLVVNLKSSEKSLCYLNALPVKLDGFRITIGNESDARIIADELIEPSHYKKISQSKEVITVGSAFDHTALPQGQAIAKDDNEERHTHYNDPSPMYQQESNQDSGERLDFSEFIRQSPHSETGEAKARLCLEVGKMFPEDFIQPIYNNPRDEAGKTVLFPAITPAVLPSNSHSNTGTLTNKGKEREQNFDPTDNNSQKCSNGMASLPIRPEEPSDGDSAEIWAPSSSNNIPPLSPLPLSQPKDHSMLPLPGAKSKLKRIENKLRAPKEIEKSLNTALKAEGEALSMKPPASQSIVGSKYLAPITTISKKGPKTSNGNKSSASQLAKIAKSRLTPASKSSAAAKLPKKKTSKLLVSKNSSLKQVLESTAEKPSSDIFERGPKSLESERLLPRIEEQTATNQQLNFPNLSSLDHTVVAGSVSRLSLIISSMLDDVDEQVDKVMDLEQAGEINQPQEVATRSEGSQIARFHEASARSQEGALSAEINSSEVIDSLVNVKNLGLLEIQSESSPSSMSQHTPLPLPPKGEDRSQSIIPNAPNVPLENITKPANARRSPRLAELYRRRQATAEPTYTRTPPHSLAEKPSSIETSQDKYHPKDKGPVKDNLLRDGESTLLDDHLARKTPLVSFGVRGPRNQGTSNLKAASSLMTRIERSAQPETHPLPTQKLIDLPTNKRKYGEAHTPDIGMNKRPQTVRLQESKDERGKTGQDLVFGTHDRNYHAVSNICPPARSDRRFGSQGSRVNENGSPRGKNERPTKPASHEIVMRKAPTDTKVATSENAGNPSDDGNDGGPNVNESSWETTQEQPTNFPSEQKSWPLFVPPNVKVIGPPLLPEKKQSPRFLQDQAEDVHQTQRIMEDPFLGQGNNTSEGSFSRSLQYLRQTPPQKSRDNQGDSIRQENAYNMNEDPEVTLVDIENVKPLQGPLSLTDVTSESSENANSQRPTTETQEDFRGEQRDEWRMALKPHQRGILDVLDQISTDLVRYLINHEKAIDDVLTEYDEGGSKLMKALEISHQKTKQQVQLEVGKLMKVMGHGYKEARQETSRVITNIRAHRVRELEKAWMEEQSRVQRLIEDGIRKSK